MFRKKWLSSSNIYNCEIDKWFTEVRPVMKKMEHSWSVVIDNLVYLISSGPTNLLACDTRSSQCLTLPARIFYLAEGDSNIDIFDPIAGKWDVLASRNRCEGSL